MADEQKRKIGEVQLENNYPGLERLIKLVDQKYPELTRQDVKRFLANDAITQQTKVQQKPRATPNEPGGHLTAFKPNELWKVDIYVMLRYRTVNHGYNYFLVCIDVFTRKAYGAIVKTKDSIASREAMSTILTEQNQAQEHTDRQRRGIPK